ncbi:MAG TPA: uroporphyrinogen-III synthase [Candidatus Acidoferrales bacterium]|nr:uroporphyrinogen-III synthase [Candidatus Acidoferrales bacterium]
MEPRGALAGKRIVITRAPGQGEGLRLQLAKNYGAQVIELPCVEFREVEDSGPLDDAIRSLSEFSWLLFTSQNAAKFFARRCRVLGVDFAKLSAPKPCVAAIGPATAEAATSEGFSVDFIPPAGTGRNFAGIFKGCVRSVAGLEVKDPILGFVRNAAGLRVLIPRSDRAAQERGAADWTDVLRDVGAEVTEVVAYRTCMPESLAGAQLDEVLSSGADCFVFASPSAFENFVKSAGGDETRRLAEASVFAAIGPTTAAAIRAGGIPCRIEAPKSTSESLAGAIAGYFGGSRQEMQDTGRHNEGMKHA